MSVRGQQVRMPVVFSVTSGKGGVGKTSLTVNLAFALAQREQRVLIIDGDLGLANVDVLLNLPVQRTIRDVLESGDDPLSALLYVEPNVAVLPSGSGVPQMLELGSRQRSQLENLLKVIVRGFDVVLVDTAAGIGASVLWLNAFADHTIVVVSPDPTSLTDAYALIKVMAREYGRERFYVLLNSVRNEREGEEVYKTLTNVTVRFLNLRPHYLGSVPQDPEVAKAVREQTPFLKRTPESKAATAIVQVAQRLLNMDERPAFVA